MSDRRNGLSHNVTNGHLTTCKKAWIIFLSIAEIGDDFEVLQSKFQPLDGEDDLTLSAKRLLRALVYELAFVEYDDVTEIDPTWFIADTLWELQGILPTQTIACLPVR